MSGFVTEEVFFSSLLDGGKVNFWLPKTVRLINGFWVLSLDSLVIRSVGNTHSRSVGVRCNLCTSYPRNSLTGEEKFEDNTLHVFALTYGKRQDFRFGPSWSSVNSPSEKCTLSFFEIDDSIPGKKQGNKVTVEEVKAYVSGVVYFKKVKQ